MKRSTFFRTGGLAVLGAGWWNAASATPTASVSNIIFMVSDGMSTGTLNMADMLSRRKYGKPSTWLRLYEENKVARALMDTASANSLVTDSAAASSSWGGGARVNNGSLNVAPDGRRHVPILQKMKQAGKLVGCVTSVPVTHATPAGFCVAVNSRGNQDEIASLYLPLEFDLFLGGGRQYFDPAQRADKQDLFKAFSQKGYAVVQNSAALKRAPSDGKLLGLFANDGLPYELDRQSDPHLQETVPSLATLTSVAIDRLSRNSFGFMLQVEGGKVDWAAHANDIGALLYDQLAFDEAVKVAVDFAAKRTDTLVVITTDHGNANPGLFYGSNPNLLFDSIQHFKHTNDWILNGLSRNSSTEQVRERIAFAQGATVTAAEAKTMAGFYTDLNEAGVYNPRKLPFRQLAGFQTGSTGVGWGSMDHSADYVELAMYGPGSEALPAFIKNYQLHNYLLKTANLL